MRPDRVPGWAAVAGAPRDDGRALPPASTRCARCALAEDVRSGWARGGLSHRERRGALSDVHRADCAWRERRHAQHADGRRRSAEREGARMS
eukprot:scaffold6781_cov188-Prasinococcus_capsulatus_cf.AAC.1